MIFQPVNMVGPAHRGPQLQQLAQQAAQNVMRRNRMRSMLRTSAGAARGAAPGGGQGLMTAQRGVHTVLSAHAPTMPNQGLVGMLGGAPTSPIDTGMYNSSGGGADFQSLPDSSDPSQSPASVQGAGSFGLAATNPGGALANAASTDPNNMGAGGPALIPLNGGLFYDPATDTVVGGGAPADYRGALNGTAHGAGIS